MEPRPPLERTAAPEEAASALPNTDYVLNIVLVYEDALTAQWASEIRERVFQIVGPQAARCTSWKLSDWSEPEVFKKAVSHSIDADMIVVSIRVAEEVPPDLCLWIDAWSTHRLQLSGVLVALLRIPKSPDPRTDHFREYLYAAARKAGLDFLVEERTGPIATPPAPPTLSETGAAEPAQALYPALQLDRNGPELRHWGINE
jgi:hypothetical protein